LIKLQIDITDPPLLTLLKELRGLAPFPPAKIPSGFIFAVEEDWDGSILCKINVSSSILAEIEALTPIFFGTR
jgi:hypothetical protein